MGFNWNLIVARRTPIDRIPQLGQREVDLFKLYHEVTKRGGLNEVVSNKGMKEVAAAFHFPPTCTNAGFALRVHYLVPLPLSPPTTSPPRLRPNRCVVVCCVCVCVCVCVVSRVRLHVCVLRVCETEIPVCL